MLFSLLIPTALGVIVCTDQCPNEMYCLSGRCVAKCTTTADCEKSWGRPADAFICSTYCYSKCLFDIDCDMSNGETCMGNVCRIECSEDSDCQWSQVQTLKQCNLTTKKCFWPCKGTPNPGELCAPDGLYRKTCSDCQQPMMCISNYCFEVCASSKVCKEADSGSSGLKVQLKCMNGSCQQYCMDDSNCEGRQLCSTIGTCAYLCNDVSCASVDRCAPDGGCRDLPDKATGACSKQNQVAIDGFCYDRVESSTLRTNPCPSGQQNFNGVCKYKCTNNDDCDAGYLCQEITGVCTQSQLSVNRQRSENCWHLGTQLYIEYQSGQACLTLSPTGNTLCSIGLPSSLLLELNVSTYKKTIRSIIFNYNYTNTTTICITCPADDMINCKKALRTGEAATVALTTPTFSAIATVSIMKTVTVDYSKCFMESGSTLQIINPQFKLNAEEQGTVCAVCASLQSTGTCPFLSNYPVHTISLTLISNYKSEVLPLDTSFFNPDAGLYCYVLGDAENVTAMAAIQSYLLDPWTHGNFTITSIMDEIEVTINVDLNFMSTPFMHSCYSHVLAYVNPDMVFVDLTPNATAIAEGKCDSPAGTNYVNVMMLLLNVVTNERLLLEYNISRFSVSSNTRLFFYPNGSYYNLNGVIYPDVSQTSTIKEKTLQMQALRRFYTALSINSSVLRGSLLLNFWRTGETAQSGVAKYFLDNIEASCFNYTVASVAGSEICITLTSTVSPTCSIRYLPSSEDILKDDTFSYDIYAKNMTVEVFDAKNLSVRTGMLSKIGNFSLNTTEYCFSCSNYILGSSSDPDIDATLSATALCEKMLGAIWKNRSQQIIGFRVQPLNGTDVSYNGTGTRDQTDPSYRSAFVTMTSIQSTNYSIVYVITFTLGGCLVLVNIALGAIMLRKVRAEMIVFAKLRRKQLRRAAKEQERRQQRMST